MSFKFINQWGQYAFGFRVFEFTLMVLANGKYDCMFSIIVLGIGFNFYFKIWKER